MGRRARYVPAKPRPPITFTRIQAGQKKYGGPWFVVLTEPWPELDRPWGQESERGPFPTQDEAREQAFAWGAEKGVPTERIFIIGPIHSFIPQ